MHHEDRAVLDDLFLPLTGPSARDRGRIELPCGRGKTNLVAASKSAQALGAMQLGCGLISALSSRHLSKPARLP
jgi:hypothetical protein